MAELSQVLEDQLPRLVESLRESQNPEQSCLGSVSWRASSSGVSGGKRLFIHFLPYGDDELHCALTLTSCLHAVRLLAIKFLAFVLFITVILLLVIGRLGLFTEL